MEKSSIDDWIGDDKDRIRTSSDGLSRNCNSQNVGSCSSIQKEISECFEFMKTFINDEDFVNHVKPDLPDMEDIEEKIDHNLLDLKRTDCSIVFAGETSSGKSSIINAIIGEKILPTGIEATTTRVCRVKYSKELKISKCDENDMEITMISCEDTTQMAERLKTIAKTNENTVTYVDIFMPIPFQEGNVAIVDTPGVGDIDQKEVADRMMDYLPNALAFVFVINVAAAGGLQKDRFIPILEHVKKSLKGMVSFDHEDVIFLLNKWDTILDEGQKDNFFKSSKEHIGSIWEEGQPDRILKLSTNKTFMEYDCLFQRFKEILQDVIAKNMWKRLKVHKRFLKHFVSKCDEIVSQKLETAKKDAKASQDDFEETLSKVSDVEKVWQETTLKLDDNVDSFLDAVTNQLHGYINHFDFKNSILQKVAKSWRLKLGFDTKAHIETEIKQWLDKHVPKIYEDAFVKNLNDKLKIICGQLSTNLMRGFQMPYDPDNRFYVGFLQSAVSIMSGIVMQGYLFQPHIAIGAAALGIAFSSLSTFGYTENANSARETAVDVRIGNLSKGQIKNNLKNNFSREIKNNMEKALNTMKCQIEKLREEAIERETTNTIHTSRMRICMSLDETVFECRQRLQNIEKKVFTSKDT